MTVSRVIDDLYGLVGSEGIVNLPALIADAVGARSCSLQMRTSDNLPAQVMTSYFSASMGARYVDEAIYLDDIWHLRGMADAPLATVINLSEVVSTNDYLHSRFYQDMIRHEGDDTGACLGTIVPMNDEWILSLGLHLPLGLHFNRSHETRLTRLLPHLRRILELQRRIDAADRRDQSLLGMIDAVAQPLFLIEKTGAIRHLNSAGESILSAGDPLYLSNGKVAARQYADNVRLMATIEKAVTRQQERGGAIRIFSEDGATDFRAFVIPVSTGFDTAALLTVDTGRGPSSSPSEYLRSLYGLTQAEAEVATLVALGQSMAAVAEIRGVSSSTCKTLLQRVFWKTGCTKATQLAALVQSLPR